MGDYCTLNDLFSVEEIEVAHILVNLERLIITHAISRFACSHINWNGRRKRSAYNSNQDPPSLIVVELGSSHPNSSFNSDDHRIAESFSTVPTTVNVLRHSAAEFNQPPSVQPPAPSSPLKKSLSLLTISDDHVPTIVELGTPIQTTQISKSSFDIINCLPLPPCFPFSSNCEDPRVDGYKSSSHAAHVSKSDTRVKHPEKKPSKNARKENLLESSSRLSQQIEVLKQGIGKVEHHFEQLKAFNLELKSKQQETSLSWNRVGVDQVEQQQHTLSMTNHQTPSVMNRRADRTEISENSGYPK